MMRLRAQAGIYLVAWFDTDKWDPEDGRRHRTPKVTIEEAKGRLHSQAAALPEGFIVRPIILECYVPASIRTKPRAKGSKPSRRRRSDVRR
jgi:hypothetical protein